MQDQLKGPDVERVFRKLTAAERSSLAAVHAVTRGVDLLRELGRARSYSVVEVAVGQNAIPNREALDKILRYETTIERQLSRAVDRLERLQSRRKGEPVLPPVNIRLSR